MFDQVTFLAAGAVTIAVQILKSRWIPVGFQKRPVLTAFIVSIIAAVIVEYQRNPVIELADWKSLLSRLLVIFLVAALTYNNIVKQSPTIKATEGPRK